MFSVSTDATLYWSKLYRASPVCSLYGCPRLFESLCFTHLEFAVCNTSFILWSYGTHIYGDNCAAIKNDLV